MPEWPSEMLGYPPGEALPRQYGLSPFCLRPLAQRGRSPCQRKKKKKTRLSEPCARRPSGGRPTRRKFLTHPLSRRRFLVDWNGGARNAAFSDKNSSTEGPVFVETMRFLNRYFCRQIRRDPESDGTWRRPSSSSYLQQPMDQESRTTRPFNVRRLDRGAFAADWPTRT